VFSIDVYIFTENQDAYFSSYISAFGSLHTKIFFYAFFSCILRTVCVILYPDISSVLSVL